MKLQNALIALISIPTICSAQGVLSMNCDVVESIQSPVNSQGFTMSKDCRTAYVLPPSLGVSKITGRTVGDMSRCSEVREFARALRETAKQASAAVKQDRPAAELHAIFEKRKLLLEQYRELANSVGASIELNFTMNTQDVVSRYQNLNQTENVVFVHMPLRDVKLSWNKQQEVDPDLDIAINRSLPIGGDDIGSGSFSARLDLTLYGACQLRDPFTHLIPERLSYRDLAGLITPNVTYRYQVAAKSSYTASYNLAGLASQIRSTATRGGFFTTSSSSSLIANAESSGWFKLEMSCDDQWACEQARFQTGLEIKQRLMNEVLQNIALTKLGATLSPVSAADPGKNGASVAADSIRKQCAHPYCQAGAIILDIGSAVFGGSSKTDSYIQTNNHTVTESQQIMKPIVLSGMMGFGG